MVKVLYRSYSVLINKCSNNSSPFGDIEQGRFRKNIIYECGFTLIPKPVQHLILNFISIFIIYSFDVEVYFYFHCIK